MYKKNAVQVVHVMLMIAALLAFGTVSAQAADVEALQRTITDAGQELDNTLSATKSIEELLASTKAGLYPRLTSATFSFYPSSNLWRTLVYVEELQTQLVVLSEDTARIANLLASISVDVEETGDSALIKSYSNVKSQVAVVSDAITQAQKLAHDLSELIRRMMSNTGTKGMIRPGFVTN